MVYKTAFLIIHEWISLGAEGTEFIFLWKAHHVQTIFIWAINIIVVRGYITGRFHAMWTWQNNNIRGYLLYLFLISGLGLLELPRPRNVIVLDVALAVGRPIIFFVGVKKHTAPMNRE